MGTMMTPLMILTMMMMMWGRYTFHYLSLSWPTIPTWYFHPPGHWMLNNQLEALNFDQMGHTTGGGPRTVAWSWAPIGPLNALHNLYAWVTLVILYVGLLGQLQGTLVSTTQLRPGLLPWATHTYTCTCTCTFSMCTTYIHCCKPCAFPIGWIRWWHRRYAKLCSFSFVITTSIF